MLMRTMIFVAAGLTLTAFGCDKNDNGSASSTPNEKPVTVTNATAPTPPPPAPAQADPLAAAANKNEVVQFSDMTRMPPTPGAIVTGISTTVRESPRGKQIKTVETGMTVDVIGKRNDYYLVLYKDPSDSSKTLAGWVYKDAIEASTWPAINAAAKKAESAPGAPANAKTASPAKLSCKSGETTLRAGGDFCAHTCKKDDDCTKSPGGLCDGAAYEVKKDGSMSTNLDHYCVLSSENVDRAAAEGHTTTQPAGQNPKAPR